MTYSIDEENYMRRVADHQRAVMDLARATRAKEDAIAHENFAQQRAQKLAQWLEDNKHLKPENFPEEDNYY